MKRTIQVVAIIVVIVAVRNLPDIVGKRTWDQIVLPYRMARLAVRPADSTLAIPVQGLSVDQIADTWHAPRAPNRVHEGQDIFAKRGTPVVSATDGVVVKIGDNALGGHAVWVLGAGGRTYYYAHLNRWAEGLYTGDEVQPGTVLGYVGNTGNARTTPPHLHFGCMERAGL